MAFELSFQTEGEGVRLQGVTDYKSDPPTGGFTDKALTAWERIGTIRRGLGAGLLRLNERRELTEMTQAGLIPRTVRVVPARKTGFGLFPI